MGGWLGRRYYDLGRRRRKIGLANLGLALGELKSEKDLRTLLKSVYGQMGSSVLEFAGLPRMTRHRIEPLVHASDRMEKIGATKKSGSGVILLTAHFGNWELLAQSSALYGYPFHIIGREANVGLLQNYIVRCRESHGNRVIIREHAARKILKILKQGGIVGLLVDQRGSTSKGLMIDFFGHPAPTDPAIARLILKSEATVLTVFSVRNPDQTHTVYVSDHMEISRSQEPEEDVRHLTRNYMKVLEDFIRKHPEQWLWMHRRWLKRNSDSV